MQTYYNRTLLEDKEAKLVHEQFCTHVPFPRNSGTTMSLRKLLKLASNTTPLTEGNPGNGQMLSETEVTMSIEEFGDYVRTTEWLDLVHLDERIERRVKRMGDAGWRSIDEVVRDEMARATSVIYANGKTARNALTPTDKLTNVELRKAVVQLKNNLADPFDGGMYVAIINPNITYDLQDDPRFLAVSQYQDKENIYTGEIGRLNGLYGVRLVEATNMKIFTGAGASSADVASVIVLGRDAIYDTDLMGAHPRVIVKNPGSAGTLDPLDQIATVGWKVTGFGVKVLQPQYCVRIECGFTA
jgi:N4-gp56 family major capsid protein